MSEDSIVTDESPEVFDTLADAEEAILSRWEKAEETPAEEPEEAEGEPTEEVPEDSEDEVTEEGSEEEAEEEGEDPEETEEPETETKAADDDAVVEYEVDGETKRVSVAELKRLAGQEAALTRKSQEVAAVRKTYETQALTALGVLQKMQQKAMERWKPYAEVDLFAASRELEPSEFDALRKDMAAAQADMNFFQQEIDQFSQQVQKAQKEVLRAQAPETIRVLKESIPEWSNSLYDSIRSYAVEQGMDTEVVNNLVDPASITLIHKARLYDLAKQKAGSKVKQVKKRMAKKPLKSSQKAPTTKQTSQTVKERLAASGSLDDAAALFMSRWADSED